METKPKLFDISPEDRERYVQAVDSTVLSLLTLAEIELKRYPDIAASSAMALIKSGAGSLGFNVTFSGNCTAMVGGFIRDDGTIATEILSLTLDANALRPGSEPVH